jgi:hypothetical protein
MTSSKSSLIGLKKDILFGIVKSKMVALTSDSYLHRGCLWALKGVRTRGEVLQLLTLLYLEQ